MDRALTALAVLLVIVAAVALWSYAGPDDGPTLLTVEQSSGDVARERGALEQRASVGMTIEPGDRLVTGPASAATISRAGRSPIQLDAETSVQVTRVDEGVVELEVQRGRVRARVRPDGGALRLQSAGRSILATDATFVFASDGEGGLSAAVEEGHVATAGVPGLGELSAGQQVVVMPDGAVRTSAIPDALLLDVQWPDTVTTERVIVTGRTEPGALVRVLASEVVGPVRADADGGFFVPVTLATGTNQVEVAVVDTLGRERRISAEVVREVKPPTTSIGLEYARPR